MSKLVLELKDVLKLESDGKTFVFNPKAEDSIHELMKLKEQVEKALETVQTAIAEQGVKLNKDFSGVRGSKVKVSYRLYGQPYKLEAKDVVKEVDKRFYKESVTYRPDSEGIKDYLSEHKKLPKGVVENKREKQVSIKLLEG